MSQYFAEQGGELVAEFTFKDFVTAFRFMTIVAEISESQNHHPTWRNAYNQVSISITTHDAENHVTEKDWGWVQAIEEDPRIQGLLETI